MKKFALACMALVVLIVIVPSAIAARAASHPETSSAGSATSGDRGVAGIRIRGSAYGRVDITTVPGAACTLRIEVEGGEYSDGPPRLMRAVAGADGTLEWSYPAPVIPAGHGRHVVTCAAGHRSVEAAVDFQIGATAIDPRGFRVRVQPVDPATVLGGVATRLEPSLVPARDAVVAELNAKLAMEWTQATRGLGTLTVVPESSDIVISVLPARGSSAHERSADGSQRVLLYVVDESGRPWTEVGMTAALHELGHIWCCTGPDGSPDGHWKEQRADPLLQGVNQFGLMTHPVVCLVRGTTWACPSRFSDRELAAMGFRDIPAPSPDECAPRSGELRARLAVLDSALDATSASLDSARTELRQMAAQIESIQNAYPSGRLPAEVHASYSVLVARYQRTLSDFNERTATHNAQVQTRNDLGHEINALPC